MTIDPVLAVRRIAPAAGTFGERRCVGHDCATGAPDPREFARQFAESEELSHRRGEGAHPLDLVA